MMTEWEGTQGGAVALAEQIEYQEGAVVSKTLLKKETGTVTLFAFDRGQELSEHTVPHDALVYLIDGEGEFTVSGTVHRLGRGDILLMPGNEPHAVRAAQRFKMLLTMVRG